MEVWDRFFHSRLGSRGCRFVGWLRVAFAVIFVADRLLLTLDIDTLLSPSTGLVPISIGRDSYGLYDNMYTVFQLAPESDVFMWIVHLIGILQGILLILGVAPRFQMIGVFVNLISFRHHNMVIWDGEDQMFKDFCLLLIFMPLHRITIYDWFGLKGDDKPEDSWPMWPIRLFQIQMSFIYLGASFGKLNGRAWIDGVALYFVTYSTDFYPGFYNPEFIFNRMGPLKLLNWASLLIEVSSWSLVWVPRLRKAVVINMILFHLGIELTMNMHCFEWLAILGWLAFLLQPDHAVARKPRSAGSYIADLVTIFFILNATIIHSSVVLDVASAFPSATPYVEGLYERRNVALHSLAKVTNPIGAYQEEYTMYDGGWGWVSYDFAAEIEHGDGTIEEWHSPKWIGMPFLQRKRYMRLMNYYSVLSQGGQDHLREQLLRSLAAKVEKSHRSFQRITLYIGSDTAPNMVDGMDSNEPARRPTERAEFPIMTMYPRPVCKDHHETCAMMKMANECGEELQKVCPKACGVCDETTYDGGDYQWRLHSEDDYEDEDYYEELPGSELDDYDQEGGEDELDDEEGPPDTHDGEL